MILVGRKACCLCCLLNVRGWGMVSSRVMPQLSLLCDLLMIPLKKPAMFNLTPSCRLWLTYRQIIQSIGICWSHGRTHLVWVARQLCPKFKGENAAAAPFAPSLLFPPCWGRPPPQDIISVVPVKDGNKGLYSRYFFKHMFWLDSTRFDLVSQPSTAGILISITKGLLIWGYLNI